MSSEVENVEVATEGERLDEQQALNEALLAELRLARREASFTVLMLVAGACLLISLAVVMVWFLVSTTTFQPWVETVRPFAPAVFILLMYALYQLFSVVYRMVLNRDAVRHAEHRLERSINNAHYARSVAMRPDL